MYELAKRGHEVVFITTDPEPKCELPKNLTQIDIHDISYEYRNKYPVKAGKINDLYDQVDKLFDMNSKLLELQMNTIEIQNLINDKNQHFDLLLIEAVMRPALVFSYIFKAPVITISSLGSMEIFTKYLGTPNDPILYPNCLHQRLNNLSLWERAEQIYKHYLIQFFLETKEVKEDLMLKKNFGGKVPTLSELKKNVEMLMINVHHLWEDHRPVPPNVIYLGGLHLEDKKTKELSIDLKSYLDSSTRGVIYMSFGSVIMPSLLQNMEIIIKSLSKLPYDVLLKWDYDHLSDGPTNIKVMKWTPQREILRHPNIKLFITQGGLQSTDEAIAAGVPLVGIPILGDQWYNVEKYVKLNIGVRIDLEHVDEENMLEAINTVINDKSYKQNIHALRNLLYDQPQRTLDRAVWWTEYVLRNGRSRRFMAPKAHLSIWQHLEIELLLLSALCLSLLLLTSVFVLFKVYKTFLVVFRYNFMYFNLKRVKKE